MSKAPKTKPRTSFAVPAGAKRIAKDSIRYTRNDTSEKVKKETIKLLNHLLAEFIDLALSTKQAHWNMRGSNFIGVHEMLDPFNDKLNDYADTIAERIVQLGGVALGTAGLVAQTSSFEDYPTTIVTVEDHLKELAVRYGALANALRTVIDKGLADSGTENILTDASDDLDKYLWFIEAHLD
ncbi:MAG: DNA starvation/stationary phase protection protein Dps [Lactobacillales bacterium]|jgi:starvation-inducible DNA-binding protein|nr:DNA starvation/stationary phase protection protein Dps [Lactobacillales bacterium]